MSKKIVVYGLCLRNREPIIDYKTKEVIDNGANTKLVLGTFEDKKMADFFFENLKANTDNTIWKIWME